MKTRMALAGMLVVMAALASSAMASAATLGPEGPFTATAGTTTFTFAPTGFMPETKISCKASTVGGTVNAPTASPQVSGAPQTFSSCAAIPTPRFPGNNGPVTITSQAPTFRVSSKSYDYLEGVKLHFSYGSFGCTFDLVGKIALGNVGGTSGVITAFNYSSFTSHLEVANVLPGGCSTLYRAGQIPVLTVASTYALNHSLTISE